MYWNFALSSPAAVVAGLTLTWDVLKLCRQEDKAEYCID